MNQIIAVNDASILIDFCDVGLSGKLHQIGLALYTTDFVVAEIQEPEQRKQVQQLIQDGGLIVFASSPVELEALVRRQASIPALSLADCSVLTLADVHQAILLTGDRVLRREAERRQIETHGSLWILDKMLEVGVLAPTEACTAMMRLIELNPRLPRAACEERRARWCM
jgi:rRNA maturation endonuclease Nob1